MNVIVNQIIYELNKWINEWMNEWMNEWLDNNNILKYSLHIKGKVVMAKGLIKTLKDTNI